MPVVRRKKTGIRVADQALALSSRSLRKPRPPKLERTAQAEEPPAELSVGRLKATIVMDASRRRCGKFGLRQIPRGFTPVHHFKFMKVFIILK